MAAATRALPVGGAGLPVLPAAAAASPTAGGTLGTWQLLRRPVGATSPRATAAGANGAAATAAAAAAALAACRGNGTGAGAVGTRGRRTRVARSSGGGGGQEGGGGMGEMPAVPPQWRPDLFLQLPFDKGVLLPGILRGTPQVPLLPPAPVLPLAIVPVTDGPGSIVPAAEAEAAPCVPFAGVGLDAALRRRLSSGPLRPISAAGRALKHVLQVAPQRFAMLRDYELLRAALDGSAQLRPAREEAEALLLCAYARFLKHGETPPRPPAAASADYDAYMRACDGAAMKALESTTSVDFQLIAKAHVLGMVQNASPDFPRLPASRARALYSNAMRFGHALRQAETRFRADGAAGTFVPLPLEAQLLREELEEVWTKSVRDSGTEPSPSQAALQAAEPPVSSWPEDDAEAAQRSLQEVLARLRRIGEARPGLATYLGWLGRFDPEALTLLATPSPTLALAMQMQADALWGSPGAEEDPEHADTVAMTPSDLVEALLFGAWLRDGAVAAEEALFRHRQRGCIDGEEP